MLENVRMDVHEARYLVEIFEIEKQFRRGTFQGPIPELTAEDRANKKLAYKTLWDDSRRQNAPGVVYVIRRQDLVKIGFSKDLDARVKCIEMHCGERVRVLAHIHGKDYPDLIPQTREKLKSRGGLWCIENVPGAPLQNAFVLCGTMFGLKVIRHRHFEASFPVLVPQCGRHGGTNSHRSYSTGAEFVTVAGNNYRRVEGAAAMGVDWYMPRQSLSQAIPPAYAEFIGRAAFEASPLPMGERR